MTDVQSVLHSREAPAEGSFRVLGVRVDAVQIPGTIARMERWIAERRGSRYIAVTGMHGVTEARDDPEFRRILNGAGLVVCDGMPLVWVGRLHGHRHMKRRVYGPELMLAFCRETQSRGYRHFFYGGAPGVPEKLAERLAREFPGVSVAGCLSPPFRPLTPEEDREVVEQINRAVPDIVWVGLSTPKQERWMAAHASLLRAPVLVGVGAAFDFHTGRVRQAPRWMGENGLEWLFRLCSEPRRLWKRYLVVIPKIAVPAFLEIVLRRSRPVK